MTRKLTTVTVKSNNHNLVELFVKLGEISDVHFTNSHIDNSPYCVYLADLDADFTGFSQSLMELINECNLKDIKITVCLLFTQKIDVEKVHYLKQLLGSSNVQPLYRLAFIKDLYQDILPLPVTYLDKVLWQSIEKGEWKTSKKGKNLLFPLHVRDLGTFIIKTLFLSNTAGKEFWVFGDKFTDLETGYLLKNNQADEKYTFEIEATLPDHHEEDQYFSLGNDTQIKLNWRPDTDFIQVIKKITNITSQKYQNDSYQSVDDTTNLLKNKVNHLKRIIGNLHIRHHSLRVRNRFLSISLKALILVATLYMASTAVFAWSLFQEYQSLNKSLDLVAKGDLEKSVLEIKNLRFYNHLSQFTLEPIKPLLIAVNPQMGEELVNLFAFNNYLSLSLENMQQTYVLADKIYKSLNNPQISFNPTESILALQSNLALVHENIVQIKVSIESKRMPGRVVKKIKSSEKFIQLTKIEGQLIQAMKLTEVLPAILKTNETTKLGILIQDQDELRPTGGLIKQLLILTISNGKIIETKVSTAEEIDSVSAGSVKAPDMLARVSGSLDLKFKDMNYPADFSQTSEYIIWFLDRTLNIKLDTLVSVNKSFLEKMIKEDGNINIAGKIIEPQDIRSSSSEIDASRHVLDYYLKSFTSGKLSLTTLGRSIISEIEEGNIKLYSTDAVAQSAIARLPISGMVTELPCHSGLTSYQECLNHVTYLNEANYIYAPINHSLIRDTVHSITLGSDKFMHEYRLKYNFQNDFSTLNRPYQVIYQLFAPSGSDISKVEVDGISPLETKSIIKLKHGQFEYFQIPLSFSAVGVHSVTIGFDTPLKSVFDPSKTSLSFTEIKQPGLSDKGTLLMIKIAENTRPLTISHQIQTIQGSLAVQLPPQTTTFGLGLGY